MFGRRSRRQRVRRTRRAHLLRLVPLFAVTTLVAALLVGVTYSQLRTDDTAGTPAQVEKRELVVTPEADREPYTPEDAALVAVADRSVSTIQEGTVVADLAPHDLPGFELLGVTWTGGVPVDVTEVQVRWQQDGQWSNWTILDPEDQPVEGGIPGTEPKWVGPSQAAQARIVASRDIDPSGLTLVTVAAGESPTLTQAAATQPNIISRAQWGARAYGGSGCGSSPENGTFQGTIVHHTAGSNTYTAEQSAGIVRSTQAYHMDGQKWCDIGYNFLVDRYGQVFEGRAGGITKTPYGAHAGNTAVNASTTGVSLMGEFTSAVPPDAMKNALVQLVAWRHSLFGVPAKGAYSNGGVTIQRIDGHRSVKATACPGQQVFNWINAPGGMRDQVEALATSYPVRGAIANLYNSTGGAAGPLGTPASDEICGLRDAACGQYFRKGMIYWHPATGAAMLTEPALTHWKASGFEKSSWGYPTSSPICGLRDGTCGQYFEGGLFYWSTSGGLGTLAEPVLSMWRSLGWESGTLGFPISGEICGLKDGGCGQYFEGGMTYRSSSTGIQPVWGGVLAAWRASGLEKGPLGYPTAPEQCAGGRCSQVFQGGEIHWSPAAGGTIVADPALSAWKSAGGGTGWLGTPRSSAMCGLAGNGCGQYFEGGLLYWKVGAKAWPIRGAIHTAWSATGWEGGPLGYPTSAEICGLTGNGCGQYFEGGMIYWSPSTGARVIREPALAAWRSAGWEAGRLGYPTSDRICGLSGNGCGQYFQGGMIYWPGAGPAAPLAGPILTAWQRDGYERGRLGYPRAAETCSGDVCTQTFEGGAIKLTRSTGATAITYSR